MPARFAFGDALARECALRLASLPTCYARGTAHAHGKHWGEAH